MHAAIHSQVQVVQSSRRHVADNKQKLVIDLAFNCGG